MLNKRLLTTTTLIFFLLVVLQTPYLNIVKASPAIIRVPQDKPTIQSAIDSAQSGDVILVSPGTYNERINITYKSISIIGENPNTTIIDGMNANATAVRIAVCTHVTIANLTIKSAGLPQPPEMEPSGIFLYNANNTVIANVTIINNGYAGILLRQSHYNRIENSLISSNNYGIWIGTDSPHNVIIHNNFVNNSLNCIIHSSNNEVFYNYWGDYYGEDADEDGVGDTPYQGFGFRDECPLIEMWTLAKLTKEFAVGTHIVTIRSNTMIKAFNYNQTLYNQTLKEIEIGFNINGPSSPSNLTFFCEVYIPKTLLDLNRAKLGKCRLLLNNTEALADARIMRDYALINFTGYFSKLEVQIQLELIPTTDFGFYLLIATLIILAIAAIIIIVKLKKRSKKSRKTLP